MISKARKVASTLVICLLAGSWLIALASPLYAGSPFDDGTLVNHLYLPMLTTSNGAAVQNPNAIPGQFIVVFKDNTVSAAGVSAIASDLVAQNGGELLQVYDSALQGFAARFPAATSLDVTARLSQDARVAFVEQDTVVTLGPDESPESTAEAASADSIDTTQTGATWGLDRLDQRNLPLSGSFTYNRNGTGVRAYVIDTGIHTSHSQFGGRASYGYDAVDGSLPADDCNGHGTHVAGTIGGSTYGVAKGVRLFAVRVLDCSGSGSNSGVIAGINWVRSQKQANPSVPMVANMSLGGSYSSALNTAVTNAINAGVTFVVAAGNSNANACNYSPASASGTITVGATTSTDTRASYSNYGSCVDIFAPGSSITSAWYTSNTATAVLSGTSMATPHVVGVVALYLQGSPSASTATVRNAIYALATANIVKSAGSGSYNRLLFTNY
ncbi:MAG: S8 family peptidase [Caldilineaceae bacterium]